MEFKKTLDNKTKAFTLAEVVVVMAVLGVMMAAFAPVITKRNVAAGSNAFKELETHNGIYYNSSSTAQKSVIIGDNKIDATTMPVLGTTNPRLILVSQGSNTPHIMFGYRETGTTVEPTQYVGKFRMDNAGNLIFGGPKDKEGKNLIVDNMYDSNNTIIGANPHPALNEEPADNSINNSTLIGSNACNRITGNINNTICVGYNSGPISSENGSDHEIYLGDGTHSYRPGNIFFGDTSLETFIETITSDIRLKNVGEEFTGGIDELNQLKFYNFTYKDDEKQEPRVGVMAQDLQKVFPNAVKEKQDGFLYIRKDDMFYAALNAIKDLFAKITDNSEKIQALEESNALIEQQNKELQNLYIELSQRVEKLDKKKTKGKLTIIPDKEVEEIPETEIQAEETTGE